MNDGARNLLVWGAEQLGVHLDPHQLGAFGRFADELKKWNRKINLTAIKGDEEIALKHFVDSLACCRMVGARGRLLDLGSGGGFPVIPLKIVRPHLDAVSVDAVEKKIIFQRHVGRLLGLHGFEALHARGEELAGRYAGHFDWIVSRAFADLPTFVRMALPCLAPDGRIVAMKGKEGRAEAETARPALTELGVAIVELQEFTLPLAGDGRSLIVLGRKTDKG
ncbi:16S rRNA (guanine(527)-N(7))-methyltransferase RsmG [Geobacter pickeringii]|uniref:Ribosomal RNA small subunit methyltransferase G n=1 Tax=Geobacter pickeringii TaxID=345632 RepID=A0A0B5BE47_9BACT|nr:16S rRNA (guanine(527)-N(7))-methyltransferase RsmG [Geobacter pickeringii]AJE04752.1 16S rRNA methyltransferase [Geobacter pickeringii]